MTLVPVLFARDYAPSWAVSEAFGNGQTQERKFGAVPY
jgi:hypothetical protein